MSNVMRTILMHITLIHMQEIKVNQCEITKKKPDYKEKQMNSAVLHMNNTTTMKEEKAKPTNQTKIQIELPWWHSG